MPLKSFTKAEILLTERKRFERPMLAMVWLAVATISIIENSMFYLLAGTLAVAVNLLAIRRGREVYLRRAFVNVAVILASGVLLIEIFVGNLNTIVALGHYLILIQLCKLFEQKTNRDYVQILTMSGLMMLTAAIRCDQIWFALTFLVYLTLVCYTTMVFTLKRGLDAAAGARLATESGPMAPHKVAWNVIRGWPAHVLRRYVIIILIVMLSVGIAMFLVAPRASRAQSSFFSKPQAKTNVGLGNSVKLGDVKKVYLSDRIVMNVHTDRTAINSYLRGKVFYRYANSSWTGSARLLGEHQVAFPGEQILDGAIVHEISMIPEFLPTVFVSPNVMYVTCATGKILASVDGLSMSVERCPDRPIKYRTYTLGQSLNDFQKRYHENLSRRRAIQAIAMCGQIPLPDRVRELAEDWCEDLLEKRSNQPDRRDHFDRAIAGRIAQQLRKRCTYTLDLSNCNPGIDGVEDFLFNMKHGHCEYFASALTVMCRALDVHARLATGFHISAAEKSTEGYVVRERDAHAWTEVFTPSNGWTIFEATPSTRYVASQSWKAFLTDFWESVKFFWYENVAGYDSGTRKRLAHWFSQCGKTIAGKFMGILSALESSFLNLLVEGYVDSALYRLAIIVAAMGIVLEAIMILRAIRRRRHQRQAEAAGAVAQKQFAFAGKFFNLLQKHAQPYLAKQTRREWALQSATKLDLPRNTVAELIDLYYRLRWGQISAKSEELIGAEKKVALLTAALTNPSRASLL